MIVDIAIIVIVAVFSLVGLQKGLVKSLVSLLGFIGALIVAYLLLQPFIELINKVFDLNSAFKTNLDFFGKTISSTIAIEIVCFVILYLLLLIAVKIIDAILSGIFKLPVLNLLDRLFGLLFGFLKGFLFVCIVYALLTVFMNDNATIKSSKIMETLSDINPVIVILTK